ncbi:MAG: AAA family ATPase [Saprospiraceae bacterium]|nr:AAA family ATPase [Saprospiraceae bacterium]
MAKINSIRVRGYRPFKDFIAKFGSLEVIVGANGSGKTSLFEFLKFLRDSLKDDIPPEIVAGSIGQQIFHLGAPEKFWWSLEMDFGLEQHLRYQGELLGPVGNTKIVFERVVTLPFPGYDRGLLFMNVKDRKGTIRDPKSRKLAQQEIHLRRPNQLALSTVTNPAMITLYSLREYIESWRFYSSFRIRNEKIKQPVPIQQDPVLDEDAGNLSAILFYLYSEHHRQFETLERNLRLIIPGFKNLTVKAKGAPGHVIAFWEEEGFREEMSLADLSDGILRLICWLSLCVQPNPPALICIDEPDQGVHPRTLPILAGMFEKASERTQVLLATHSSYFLTQFDISKIAIMRKELGEAKFYKPTDSEYLKLNLAEFGAEEIELMHRNDELEQAI